jgi:hypothetical protein
MLFSVLPMDSCLARLRVIDGLHGPTASIGAWSTWISTFGAICKIVLTWSRRWTYTVVEPSRTVLMLGIWIYSMSSSL